MNYVYVLKSKKDNGFYIGYTKDLKKRFLQHNSGYSKSTKPRAPFVLIYYEAFSNNKDARAREVFLKSGYGRKQLLEILKNTLL
jgi:putative endonuclease